MNPYYIFYDAETDGAYNYDVNRVSVMQMSWLVTNADFVIISSQNLFIKGNHNVNFAKNHKFDAVYTNTHGVSIVQALTSLLHDMDEIEQTGGRMIVHNADHHMAVLHRVCREQNLRVVDCTTFCTMKDSSVLRHCALPFQYGVKRKREADTFKYPSLRELYQCVHDGRSTPHGEYHALQDAHTLRDCYMALCKCRVIADDGVGDSLPVIRDDALPVIREGDDVKLGTAAPVCAVTIPTDVAAPVCAVTIATDVTVAVPSVHDNLFSEFQRRLDTSPVEKTRLIAQVVNLCLAKPIGATDPREIVKLAVNRTLDCLIQNEAEIEAVLHQLRMMRETPRPNWRTRTANRVKQIAHYFNHEVGSLLGMVVKMIRANGHTKSKPTFVLNTLKYASRPIPSAICTTTQLPHTEIPPQLPHTEIPPTLAIDASDVASLCGLMKCSRFLIMMRILQNVSKVNCIKIGTVDDVTWGFVVNQHVESSFPHVHHTIIRKVQNLSVNEELWTFIEKTCITFIERIVRLLKTPGVSMQWETISEREKERLWNTI